MSIDVLLQNLVPVLPGLMIPLAFCAVAVAFIILAFRGHLWVSLRRQRRPAVWEFVLVIGPRPARRPPRLQRR